MNLYLKCLVKAEANGIRHFYTSDKFQTKFLTFM